MCYNGRVKVAKLPVESFVCFGLFILFLIGSVRMQGDDANVPSVCALVFGFLTVFFAYKSGKTT